MNVVTVIEGHAVRTPEAPAVVVGAVPFTYKQVVGRAHDVGARLVDAGVGRESFVGVISDRSLSTIVGFLGVLMAGGAYVPLAKDAPAARMQAVIGEAGIRTIVGSSVPQGLQGLGLTSVATGSTESDAPVLPARTPRDDDAAYAIFTSGSTGVPKGVVVSRGALLCSTRARFDTYPRDAVVYMTCAPLDIDAAVAGLYFALCLGGCVVIPDAEEVMDPLLLGELMVDVRATHVDAIPAQYAAVLEYEPDAIRGLRCVVLGGETLPPTVVRRHLELAPLTLLFNEYGPTEGTVWCTTHLCSLADAQADDRPVPIGRARDSVRMHVVDADLNDVEPGQLGQVAISGPGIARGYLGRPAATAERFVPAPQADRPGDRLYLTGDLGQVDPQGELVFRGRADHLVKVRGFRVELGEVEGRIVEHPLVREAVVVTEETPSGVRLVALVAPTAGRSPGRSELAEFVARRLPIHMVPAVWRELSGIPTTPAGKADRQLLATNPSAVGRPLHDC